MRNKISLPVSAHDSELKKWFLFNKRERNAAIMLLVLMSLTCLLMMLPPGKHHTTGRFPYAFDSLVEKLTDTFPDYQEKEMAGTAEGVNLNETESLPLVTEEHETRVTCKDPNTMAYGDWYALGLPGYLIRTILHYREAGGVFYREEDLKKVYGMTDSLYLIISSWIELPDSFPETAGTDKNSLRSFSTETVDINHADSLAWLSLPGLGPVLTGRILKYRNLLGGFYSVRQLGEVYGLPETTLLTLEPLLKVDTSGIRRLNLNTCSYADLVRHPYITAFVAKGILAYREYKGRLSAPDELVTQHLMDTLSFNLVRPYLSVK